MLLLLIVLFAASDASSQTTLEKITLTGTKPPARSGHALANVDGNVFLFGGADGSLSASGIQPAGRVSPQGLFDDIWQFNEGSTTFNEIVPVPPKPEKVKFFGSTVHDRKIWTFFGLNEINKLNLTVNAYDPAQRKWTTNPSIGPEMPEGRIFPSVVSNNDSIFVIGGLGGEFGEKVFNENWEYNPATGVWTKLASMPESRYGAAAAVVNNKIFVAGGYLNGSRKDIFVYDMTLNNWTQAQVPAEMIERALSAYAQVGNSLYLFGGEGMSSILDDVLQLIFNADNTITAKRPRVFFPTPLSENAAALIDTDALPTSLIAEGFNPSALQRVRILIFGGVNGAHVSDDTFIFTDTIEVADAPDTERPQVTNVLVADGAIKVKHGKTVTIDWQATDNVAVDKQFIELSIDNGQTFAPISDTLAGNASSFQWMVDPTLPSGKATIRVRALDRAGNQGDGTSGRFKIK